jgi:hypothetical protein
MQKRAPNRYPPPIGIDPANAPNQTPAEVARSEEAWRSNLCVGWNGVTLINMFRPSDSLESCRRVFTMAKRLEEISANGNLEALQEAFEEIRSSSDPIMNRSTSWEFWDNYPRHLLIAYKNNHWHIIEYLAQQPELHITPPKPSLGIREPDFPSAVADRALETKNTGELARLLSLGWDINSHGMFRETTLWYSSAL